MLGILISIFRAIGRPQAATIGAVQPCMPSGIVGLGAKPDGKGAQCATNLTPRGSAVVGCARAVRRGPRFVRRVTLPRQVAAALEAYRCSLPASEGVALSIPLESPRIRRPAASHPTSAEPTIPPRGRWQKTQTSAFRSYISCMDGGVDGSVRRCGDLCADRRTGSLSAAAGELGTTQPSISRHLRALERSSRPFCCIETAVT